MELLLGLLVLGILLGPWIAVWILHHRIREQAETIAQRFGSLAQRLQAVETAVKKLERASAEEPQLPRAIQPLVPPEPATVSESHNVEPTPQSRVAEEIPLRQPVTAKPVTPTVAPSTPKALTPSAPPTAARQETAAIADKIRMSGGLEDLLGKNWLNKAGIVLLVMGVAFLLQATLKALGPAGKILLGYASSLALLGVGIWSERFDRYRMLARAGIGGGWALLFFTTYAMYHVPAAQVLTSQLLDLILMLGVALAMVAHTLRYNSQVVTGLAFLLAYLTIFVSRVSVYSLTAGVVLALGIVLIVARKRWFELEVFGIIATYLNHYFWLRSILEPMGENRQSFAEFLPSAAILISYWLIYRVSYVARRVETDSEEHISTVAAMLNTAFLLALMRYQSLHPEWAFWVLLALGTAEMAFGQLPATKRRRVAFAVLTTMGATLLIAAIPFRYSGENVSVLWIMESEALFLIGIWSCEAVFTRLGLAAGIATAGQMLGVDVFRVFVNRIEHIDLGPDYRVGLLVVGLGAAVLYANSHWFSRKWPQTFSAEIDRQLLTLTSYAAAALATAALWMAFPDVWTAVAWSMLALSLAIVGRHFEWEDLAIQANVISAAALVRVLVVNLASMEQFHGISLRLVSVSMVAALYYLTAHWTGFSRQKVGMRLSSAYTWTASVLVAVLICYEADPIYVALLWCIFGLTLFQIGLRNRDSVLRWQAYLAVAASFARMLLFNLAHGPQPADFSARVYSVVPIAIICFYIFASNAKFDNDNERHLSVLFAWLGTMAVLALTWYECLPDWTVTAWACVTLLLLAVADLLKISVFTQQGVIVAAVVLLRAVLFNFDGLTPGWSERSVAVAAASAILFASLYFCFRLRKVEGPPNERPIELTLRAVFDRPEQTFFFVPLLMTTILLGLEMRSGLTTVSWGIEAVLVFFFALWVNERSYQLSGLALLLLCVGKIVVIDVWGLNPRDRYITFIIMGCALLLVSFLYTRHRDTIKQYL